MNRLTTLRVLIVIQLFAAALWVALDQASLLQLQGVLGDAQAALRDASIGPAHWLALALSVPGLVAIVGVWRGQRWGRNLYTVVTAASLLFLDSSVVHPLEDLLGQIQGMADGALLGLMWLAPAADAARPAWHRHASTSDAIDAV